MKKTFIADLKFVNTIFTLCCTVLTNILPNDEQTIHFAALLAAAHGGELKQHSPKKVVQNIIAPVLLSGKVVLSLKEYCVCLLLYTHLNFQN